MNYYVTADLDALRRARCSSGYSQREIAFEEFVRRVTMTGNSGICHKYRVFIHGKIPPVFRGFCLLRPTHTCEGRSLFAFLVFREP